MSATLFRYCTYNSAIVKYCVSADLRKNKQNKPDSTISRYSVQFADISIYAFWKFALLSKQSRDNVTHVNFHYYCTDE